MKKYILPLIFALLSLSSCDIDDIDHDDENDNSITGIGPLVSHQMELNSFSKIIINGQASVNVIYGDTQKIIVRAQQNIFDIIDLHSINKVLTVGLEDSYSIQSSKGIFVDIISPKAIIDYSINGAGNIDIAGKAQDDLNISISGAGNIRAYNIEVKNVKITISGAASCETKVTDLLNVIISGTGTIKYKGNPTINQTISGVGTIQNEN